MSKEEPTGNILHQAIDGQISEFMDDYIIIGIKAGTEQRMLVSSIKPKKSPLKKIFNECSNWAWSKEGYEQLE